MSKEFKSDEDIKKFISEKPQKKFYYYLERIHLIKLVQKKIFKEYLKKMSLKYSLKKRNYPRLMN